MPSGSPAAAAETGLGARAQLLTGIAIGGCAAAIALLADRRWALAFSLCLLLLPLAWWTLAEANRWIALFLCSAVLLPPLPLALGDSGPHPAVLFAALGVCAGWLRLERWRFRLDLLGGSLLLYFAVLLGSTGIAALHSGATVAAATLARVLLFGISVYLFFYVAHGPGSGPLVRTIFWAATASAIFACLDFYFQLPAPAGFGPQFVWLDSGAYRRAQGLFYEASTLGNFCVFWLVMIAAALLRPRQDAPVSRPALALAAMVFATALALSYSRASLLNLGVAMSALLWLHGRGRLRSAAKLLTVLAASGLLLALLLPQFAGTYWLRLRASAEFLFPATGAVLSGRLESWRTLGQFLAEHPWAALVGIGYKTLPYTSVAGRPVIADNMYLSTLVETGIVGLTAMLLLSLAILRAAYRARSSLAGTGIFCFWAGQMVQMLSGDLLTYWRVLPFYFWVLAMAVRK